MATLLKPLTDSREKLLQAAEALFAKGGFENVSLREIASAAGQKNHHAVQYHFGNREGLITAIFCYRMAQMEESRAAMLAAAEEAGNLANARTLVEIVFIPQLALPGQQTNPSYANFLCQYLLRNKGTAFGDFGVALPNNIARALELLRKRMSHLPEAIAQRRLVNACFMFLNMLSAYSGDRLRNDGDECFEDAVHDTLDQIVVATMMPLQIRGG
jgi:AcrR family transcriptional regulator